VLIAITRRIEFGLDPNAKPAIGAHHHDQAFFERLFPAAGGYANRHQGCTLRDAFHEETYLFAAGAARTCDSAASTITTRPARLISMRPPSETAPSYAPRPVAATVKSVGFSRRNPPGR
jgi:hypothetical protein